jgi:nicotinamidase-related amidase
MSRSDLPDRLDRRRTVLVVIDIQEKFRDVIHGIDRVLAGTERMIRFCRHLDIPVVVTEHYPRGLGVTVSEVRSLCQPFEPIEKIAFSCAGNATFNRTIHDLGRDQVILCGIETHVCIYQTAFDMLRQGKQVTVAVDAVSSCSAADREIGLRRMAELGVQQMGVQMMMFELLGEAGTPEFKAVAGLLKN